jgi:hypothetical protein
MGKEDKKEVTQQDTAATKKRYQSLKNINWCNLYISVSINLIKLHIHCDASGAKTNAYSIQISNRFSKDFICSVSFLLLKKLKSIKST